MGCGLQKIPCKLLTGRVTTGSYRDNKREFCKTSDGENQINCPGNKNFDERNGTLNFRLFELYLRSSAIKNTYNILCIDKCEWFGTATFCEGECPKGWKEMLRSKSGDGKQCWTGSKAYCCEYRKFWLYLNFNM